MSRIISTEALDKEEEKSEYERVHRTGKGKG